MDAELGHLRPRNLHVDRLALLAPDFHPGDVLDQEKLPLDCVGRPLQLGIRITVAAQRQDDAVDVAEIVADGRRAGVRRQLRLRFANLPPQLVPNLRHLVAAAGVVDVDVDDRQPGAGNRPHLVQPIEALDGLLDHVGHLLLNLRGRSAGVLGDDQGRLEGVLRILQLAEMEIRPGAGEHQQQARKHHDRALPDNQFSQSHASPRPFGASRPADR